MSQLEVYLQMTIIAMLRNLYPDFVINLSLNGISLNGLSSRQKSQIIAQCKREGMENGIQDFSLYLPEGHILNLELKTTKGKQSVDQLAIQAKLEALGHTYHVIREYREVFALIAEHTSKSYRRTCFTNITYKQANGKLTEQFLHWPIGTDATEVSNELYKLYHI